MLGLSKGAPIQYFAAASRAGRQGKDSVGRPTKHSRRERAVASAGEHVGLEAPRIVDMRA
jgi:hypothetical protein